MNDVTNPGITRSLGRMFVASSLGVVFAIGVSSLWALEGRWFVVSLVGIALVSIAMVFSGRLSHFLLIVLLFSVPLAGFCKWLFLENYSEHVMNAAPTGGAFSIGITDFILAGLYMTWLLRVLVLREVQDLKWEKTDTWVALLVLASVFSLWGAEDLLLGFGAVEHLLKHALVYFYVSRHYKREHLPWLLAAIAVAILMQASLSVVQNQLGLLRGLIFDKGAGGDKLNFQYTVPGIEDLNRATGTTYDSHALGLYMVMLVPFVIVFMYMRAVSTLLRLLSFALLLMGLVAATMSYSRSAWLGCVIAIGVTTIGLLKWRERYVLPSIFVTLIVGVFTGPWLLGRIFERFQSAPDDLLTGRFEQFPIAWSIWREKFLFGNGAGNYMGAMFEHNLGWTYDYPVHNAMLYIAADTGLFGLIAYVGLVLVALHSLRKLVDVNDEGIRRVALASLAGLIAYLFDGLSNPLFRESVVYMMFWIIIALSVALTRQYRTEHAGQPGVAPDYS